MHLLSVDEDDKDLLLQLVSDCLNTGVCYICAAGQLASLTDDYFDEEIVDREIKEVEKTGREENYDNTPMTDFDFNFDEGLWFAITHANLTIEENYVVSTEVICLDCTKQKLSIYLKQKNR